MPQRVKIDLDGKYDRLAISNEEAGRLTWSQRTARLDDLTAESNEILDFAYERLVYADKRTVAATVVLFSGGNDSTVLAHLFRNRATHAAHANTTIGIEQTRQFVRDTCASWGLPLIERMPPRLRDRYRAMVLEHGFPGPGHHYKMFQRLKERALDHIRNELIITSPWKERVVYLAGRRRMESERRANVPELERVGSIVWVSPLVNWTKVDMNTYRLIQKTVPVNEVSDILHMSGECLCGSFAKLGERDEISMWFPGVMAEIEALEAEIKDATHIPDHAKKWGWGADPEVLKNAKARYRKKSKSGRLCSSCDVRFAAAA